MGRLLSGGAKGADSLWSEVAIRHGHQAINYVTSLPSRNNMKDFPICMSGTFFKLTQEQLNHTDHKVRAANEYLKRTFPTNKTWLDNLLRRNYYQIQTADSLYAVGFLGFDGSVLGGTAWAVQMFIMERQGHAYFFDQNRKSWFVRNRIDPNYQDSNYNSETLFNLKWNKINKPPVPSGTYAGIGSRDIQDSGVQAISQVFLQ